MFKKWFSLGVLAILVASTSAYATSCWYGLAQDQHFNVTIMSYNVDTPEKDWDDWNNWRKASVVDVMTGSHLHDFYGLQETKYGGGSQVCDQIKAEINSRDVVRDTHRSYDYISIENLEHNPGQDCENSIFFNANEWECLASDGLYIFTDWDPRYAFYGVFKNIAYPSRVVIVFNTHAPAGNWPHPGAHNGFSHDDFKKIADYITEARKTVSSDQPELVPVIFTGDWNGDVQKQQDLQGIGVETCRIKAGKKGDVGPTWPSTNPTDSFDQILAGQQGIDWSKSSVSVEGRGDASIEKASDHLPIQAELYFLPTP